jgi:hypothetical protein
MLLGVFGRMEQVSAEPFLFSANPNDVTVTRIDLATGQSTVIMDANDGLTRPSELTVDQFGNLYVANVFSPDILRLSMDGQITVFVSGQGILSNPHGLAFGSQGDLFIADGTSIYRFNTRSGSLVFFGDVTSANQAFNVLEDIEFDHNGNLYAASGQNVQGLGAIVKFDSQGNASVFATGLQNPRDLAVDDLGHLYVANRVGQIVNRLDLSTGSIQLFADLSQASGDPRGVKTDLENNVYVLNSNGDIRKWNSDGIGGNIEFQSGSSFSEALAFFSGGPPSRTICSFLGNDPRPSLLDQDIFTFTGTAGERVTVRVEKAPAGVHTGERVTLILSDAIRGAVLVQIDNSALPNEITVTLPATGTYLIIIAEQPLLAPGERFRGDYCVTLEASEGTSQTLAPTAWVE